MKNKQDFWDEWTTLPIDDKSAAFELAGIMLSLLPNFSGRRLWVFKRAVALCKQLGDELAQHLEIPRNYHGRVRFPIPHELFEKFTSPNPLSSRRKAWHWLRGIYGNCGNIFSPRTGYYLALRIPDENLAGKVSEVLDYTGCKFSFRAGAGAGEFMIRKQDTVVSFLNGMGLNSLVFEIEERAIMRGVRDQANRLVNCDAANINKSVRAAERQIEIAEKIKSSPNYKNLPPNFTELIEARLENPSATLSDLGASLSPPISKSTVRYRWNKIEKAPP